MLEAESLAQAQPGHAPEVLQVVRGLQRLAYRRRPGPRVARRDENAADTMIDQLRDAADLRRQHGAFLKHRFEDGEGRVLEAFRRQNGEGAATHLDRQLAARQVAAKLDASCRQRRGEFSQS